MSESNHRKLGIGLALAGLAVVGGFVFYEPGRNDPAVVESPEQPRHSEPGEFGSSENVQKPGGVALPKGTEQPEIHVLDIAETAAQLNQPDLDPVEDLMILENILGYYRKIYGANPEGGLNFEIVGKLIGKNERKVALLKPNHPSLNAEGELEDRWGTPYWFHPVSRDLMEIVSAGPDKNLWTEDDVRIE